MIWVGIARYDVPETLLERRNRKISMNNKIARLISWLQPIKE